MIQLERQLEPSEILEVLRGGQRLEFKALLRAQPETVVDAAFADANPTERLEFLRLMPVERAATTFTDLPLFEQADYVTQLPPDRLRVMGAFIGPDEIADLLQELPNGEARDHLLKALPKTLSDSALELLQYAEDDAGGMMTPEFIAVKAGWSVQHTLQFLRQAADHAETVSNLYVVDAQDRLTGVIALQTLVTAPPYAKVEDIAKRELIYARTDTDQEEVARLMRDYDLSVMPVVDETGVLKGIITIDDVVDVIQEEATEDIYKGAAMEGSEIEYLRTSPVELWRKRVLWLAALSVSELLTVTVNASYEDLLKQQIVLQSYIAALIGTGGNTGSQSAVLVIRAISQGQIRGRDALKVLFKEFSTGLLLGVTLAVFAFVRVLIINTKAGVSVALVISLAVFAIVFTANIVGAMLPIAFYKLKIDPALTSSPFLATIMDATGLLIYFNIAKLILGL
jgi:magnesium transporter